MTPTVYGLVRLAGDDDALRQEWHTTDLAEDMLRPDSEFVPLATGESAAAALGARFPCPPPGDTADVPPPERVVAVKGGDRRLAHYQRLVVYRLPVFESGHTARTARNMVAAYGPCVLADPTGYRSSDQLRKRLVESPGYAESELATTRDAESGLWVVRRDPRAAAARAKARARANKKQAADRTKAEAEAEAAARRRALVHKANALVRASVEAVPGLAELTSYWGPARDEFAAVVGARDFYRRHAGTVSAWRRLPEAVAFFEAARDTPGGFDAYLSEAHDHLGPAESRVAAVAAIRAEGRIVLRGTKKAATA